ncbi:hypothetical protein EJK55_0075 [Moraxella catarrhalis]|uniref:Uncharacterized protein n=1 Tax=Moraxella catarrhalis TaxID=480 RepID=A0ABY0BHV4_MORCA|nr:hypothetical protein MCR_0375 [Moraxella catarrhalis BBH18]AZQ86829.1 hypothetical protein EJK52_0403 [Moraxella catarrhalis]EKF83915.1 hypothetical protein MCRH_0428 [Moraxella catarrhalis RH4]AZQ89616.1 hypothetical protein EJK50_0401 [Moraxella catarrhalis]AZQ90773.1 hypothetical protein EJK51_0402 [Moraxella catarrhalis]
MLAICKDQITILLPKFYKFMGKLHNFMIFLRANNLLSNYFQEFYQ